MKYLIFDFDGTIHNTSNIYINAFRKVEKELLEKQIIDTTITEKQIVSYIGDSPQDMWAQYLPNKMFDEVKEYSTKIGKYMIEGFHKGLSSLYPNSKDVLKTLQEKGYKLIILSNCKVAYMESARSTFNLDQYFIDYYTSEAYNFIPKSEILCQLIKEYPGEHIMIGDRHHDIDAALNNNIPVIHCGYGYAKENEIDSQVKSINNIKELLTIL